MMIFQYAFAIENNQDITIKEENGIIYLIDNITKSKKELIHGYAPLLSNNKTKFIYIKYPLSEYWSVDESIKKSFYLYSLATKENKLLYKDQGEEPFYYESWSPYDRYIIFDGGTSNLRTKYVFDITQNKIITDFQTFDTMSPYDWIKEDKIIYMDSSDYLGSNTKIRKQKIIE